LTEAGAAGKMHRRERKREREKRERERERRGEREIERFMQPRTIYQWV
jgi:hypothetical protein